MLSPNTDKFYNEANLLEMQSTIASLDQRIYVIASLNKSQNWTYDQLKHETFKLALSQWVKYHP